MCITNRNIKESYFLNRLQLKVFIHHIKQSRI